MYTTILYSTYNEILKLHGHGGFHFMQNYFLELVGQVGGPSWQAHNYPKEFQVKNQQLTHIAEQKKGEITIRTKFTRPKE